MSLTCLLSLSLAFAPPPETAAPPPAPAPTPAPESKAPPAPRDTARSHESRWGFSVAGLGHSARRGPNSLRHPDPGLALTTELRLVRGENSQLWLGVEGALWHAEDRGRTLALRAQFGYRLILGIGLGFEMYGGPGFAFHRWRDDLLPPCGCDEQAGRLRGLLGGIGVGVLFDLGQVSRVPIAAYARYEGFIERPLGASSFYLVPHQAVHVGVRLTIPGPRRR